MPEERDKKGKIGLSVPWSSSARNVAYVELRESDRRALGEQWREQQDSRNVMGGMSEEMTQAFLRERTRLHETYIKEQELTKRIGIILSAVLILSAAALILFAPEGRETLSYWIGAALVIFAAGAMGYQRIWGKSKNISFGADQDRNDL